MIDWAALLGAIGGVLGVIVTIMATVRQVGDSRRRHELDKGVALIQGYGQMVDDMQARIMALTGEIARLQAQIEAMVSERNKERTEWEQEREQLRARIADLMTERAELRGRVEALEAERCREAARS